MNTFDIPLPMDCHVHLRSGSVLRDTVFHASRVFGAIIIMPNLTPPIRCVDDAIRYKAEIDAYSNGALKTLFALYLTDETSIADVEAAAQCSLIVGYKLYPANTTTNSAAGVTSIPSRYEIFRRMASLGLKLLIHGESSDPSVDEFDRERVFIHNELQGIISAVPDLLIVLEHITTLEAVQFVQRSSLNLRATITPHHLLSNRSQLFSLHGMRPHLYCKPILKTEQDREALLEAAVGNDKHFFLGSDTAPHPIERKECSCCAAGVFTGYAVMELLAQAFASVNALSSLSLSAFACENGAEFYGVSVSCEQKCRFECAPWIVPSTYPLGDSIVVPFKAGEMLTWTCRRIECDSAPP